MNEAYILIVRVPEADIMEIGGRPVTMIEQLNSVAYGLLKEFTGTAVWEVADPVGRQIRFTSTDANLMIAIASYARGCGLDVVRGPVLRPDAASEQLLREISHLSWRYLERRAADPGITDEAMQLVQARLGKKELELTQYIRTWEPERIANRLLNQHLAAAERQILQKELDSR